MIQDVFIIGATGKVGNVLVRQIIERGDMDSKLHLNPKRIVGLASSTHMVYSPRGLLPQDAYNFISRQDTNSQPYSNLGELLDVAQYSIRNEKSTLVFIDVTSLNEEMRDFHLRVIEETPYGIVTANKNPIALSDYSIFQRLTNDPKRYGYRCSVMAGAHAVPFLQELRDVNDRPLIVEGCFSGTLGYITSELEKDRRFSDIIKEAYSRGYTEPHPKDDLSGLDVARKLVVLARTAGYPVEMTDIKLNPFIPKELLLEDDVQKFLDSMTTLDEEFGSRMSYLIGQGKTLRYIAHIDAREKPTKLDVTLNEVPKQSHFGTLEGTLNKLVVVTRVHPEDRPYSLQSQGAGLEVTAENIRGDLLYLLPERKNRVEFG